MDPNNPFSKGCKLVVEIPRLDDVDIDTCQESSLNSLYQSVLQNCNTVTNDDINTINPLEIHASAMHLLHYVGQDEFKEGGIHMHGDGEDKTDKRPFACQLLGLSLPIEIIDRIDGGLLDHQTDATAIENTLDDAQTRIRPEKSGIRDRIENTLPFIHPCLTQLQPCALLRRMTTHEHDENLLNFNQECSWNRSSMDILLFKVPYYIESDWGEMNEDLLVLYTIIEEINGEPMPGANSSVIQAFTVCDVEFQFLSSNSTEKQKQAVEAKGGDLTNVEMDIELPTCPVCRYRIIPERLGLPALKPHQRCCHDHDGFCQNMQFLAPWTSTSCKACRLLQKRLELSGAQPFLPDAVSANANASANASANANLNYYNDARRASQSQSQSKSLDYNYDLRDDLKCYKCNMEETLWVCLTCGLVGCGRYSSGHAEKHYMEQRHPFSLELATQRIWDYETSAFIQRDDLLNCPFMQQIVGAVNRAAYHGAAMSMRDNCDTRPGSRSGIEFGSTSTKKTAVIGEQYEVLLQSAMEDQAQHYEGEISYLEAELAAEAVNMGQVSPLELKEVNSLERAIHEMRMQVDQMSRHLVVAQAEEVAHRAKNNVLQKGQGIAKQLLDKLREELERERKEGEQQIEELELQVSDITANIRMREQIANNDNLREAHIFGTSGEAHQPPKVKRKSTKRGKRK